MAKAKRTAYKVIDINNEQVLFNYKTIMSALIIIVAGIISYQPALHAGFTNWDDDKYVVNNPDIQQLTSSTIKKYFSESYMGNYHPVTMLSFAIDYKLAKLNPRQFHLTNVIFHLLNSMLVFWLVLLLVRRWEAALIAGVLFGVHTLHVESVAWISERKDVLYAFFFFLSLIMYIIFVKKRKSFFYVTALLFFILSLLSKGMAVTLSITLIAVDFYLGRDLKSKTVILEKLPFLLIALVMGLVAVHVQQVSPVNTHLNVYSVLERVVIGGNGFVEYVLKLLIPVQLSHFYPYPEGKNLPTQFYIYFFIFLITCLYLVYSFLNKKLRKIILFCFLFFLFNVIHVLQLFPVGEAIMADRYAYVSSAGFFLLLGSLYESFFKTTKFKIIYSISIFLYVILLVSLTRDRCNVWNNNLSLWNDMISKYPSVALAYNSRGIAHADAKNFTEAIADYTKALSNDKTYFKSYYNLGLAKYQTGRFQEAIDHFNEAIALDPANPNYYSDRGLAKSELKNYEGALSDYEKAIALDKIFQRAYYNIGVLKFNTGDRPEACLFFRRAKEFGNKDADAIIKQYCK